jgi:tetratricopeptide (TPR) repeat protein
MSLLHLPAAAAKGRTFLRRCIPGLHRTRRGPNLPGPRLSLWKKLSFSLLVVLVVFTFLELTLLLLGVAPVTVDSDPFVGFASELPLYVPQTDAAGRVWMVTAENKRSLFNDQRFLRSKPRGTFRVFCLGGSTTYGRPYDDQTSFARWLREFLPAADDSRQWEVVNAGGISYASYRVAALMEALARYQPDLFIVYTGHNEFLERRAYAAMLHTPPWVRGLHARLAGLRTYAVLRRSIRARSAEIARGVEQRDLLPAEVDAILDRSHGLDLYHRDQVFARRVIRHYRISLERMVAVARYAGAEVLLVAPAANLRDFEPFKSQHREGLSPQQREAWQGLVHRAGSAFEDGDYRSSLAALDEAARIDDRYARLHFLRGRVLGRLGRWREARSAFVRARDEDVCPLRALTPVQRVVREVAAGERVPLVDFAEFVARRADYGIPGSDWFVDHVHPTIKGHRLLALELVDAMRERGLLNSRADRLRDRVDDITDRVMEGLDSRAHADALRNLAKVMRWAGKTEVAARLALQAVAGLPGDREAHFLAGDACYRAGELDRAVAQFSLALEADSGYVRAQVRLAEALRDKGALRAARNYLQRAVRLEPQRAGLHVLLGDVLLQAGEVRSAEAAYRRGLELDPRSCAAHQGLAAVASTRDRWDDARRWLEAALEFHPADAETHQRLAAAFARLGRDREAADEFSIALLLDPDRTGCYEGLGQLAERTGRLEEARAMYEKALQLDPADKAAEFGR